MARVVQHSPHVCTELKWDNHCSGVSLAVTRDGFLEEGVGGAPSPQPHLTVKLVSLFCSVSEGLQWVFLTRR